MMDQNQMGAKCSCPHHKMGAIWIILFGLLFLLAATGVISDYVNSILWPIVVILFGLQKIFNHKCHCCNK
ncbi:hypothetical protein KGQ24_03750 [Patescibacteria group bacterium]|nr:hypothetical protein [Patescibacteria group bacterium]